MWLVVDREKVVRVWPQITWLLWTPDRAGWSVLKQGSHMHGVKFRQSGLSSVIKTCFDNPEVSTFERSIAIAHVQSAIGLLLGWWQVQSSFHCSCVRTYINNFNGKFKLRVTIQIINDVCLILKDIIINTCYMSQMLYIKYFFSVLLHIEFNEFNGNIIMY